MEIGLVKDEYGWERVLEQEKTPWNLVSFDKSFDNYSVIILNFKNLSDDKIEKIRNYVKNGGALLTDTLSFKKINSDIKMSSIYIKRLVGKGNLFRNISEVNIEKKGFVIRDSKLKSLNKKNYPIYSFRYGKGFVIILPFDLNLLMLDERSEKIYFPSNYALPKENASLVSKGDLRRLVVNCFHHLHSLRNIPYTHVWYYPRNYKSVFCYRIDLDIFDKEEINNIIRVIKNNDYIKFTWFLSVVNNQNYENGIKELYQLNQDLQSHSYKHLVYDSLERNYENVLRSNEFVLKICKKNPSGFAAPFGHWNKNLGVSLEKLDYVYSSEFSLSYDDMPFYPMLNNTKSKVMQLPIYPICVGSLIIRFYSKNKMKSYFDYLINMQYKKQMPLFLYDHPNDGIGKSPEILEHIIKRIKGLDNVLISTLTDFSFWWKKREKVKFDVSLNDNIIKIKTNNKHKDVYLRIIFPNYVEALLPLKNQRMGLNDINKRQIPEFSESKITFFGIMKSKLLFSVFYFRILVKSVKNRLMHF